MSTLKIALIVALVSLLVGGIGGYKLTRNYYDAKAKVEVDAELKQANKRLADRVEEENTKREDAEAKLAAEQSHTLALGIELSNLKTQNSDLQGEIAHAEFKPKPVPAVAGSCPGSAFATDEFVRLYGEAAGGVAPGAGNQDTGAGGVYPQRSGDVQRYAVGAPTRIPAADRCLAGKGCLGKQGI